MVEYVSTGISLAHMMTPPLSKAVTIVGGKIALAKILGLDRTAIYSWSDCPPERVIQVSEATDWEVTPHELRPDLYPNPSDALPVNEI